VLNPAEVILTDKRRALDFKAAFLLRAAFLYRKGGYVNDN